MLHTMVGGTVHIAARDSGNRAQGSGPRVGVCSWEYDSELGLGLWGWHGITVGPAAIGHDVRSRCKVTRKVTM